MAEIIREYSPNIQWGKQQVEIVLMQWGYRESFKIFVGGNCHGLSVIECAVGILYDNLLTEGSEDPAKVVLVKGNDSLHCTDDEDRGEEWLKNMIVSAQIIDWIPPTLNEVQKWLA